MVSWFKKYFLKRSTAEPAPSLPYTLDVSVQTDVGCHREINEDCGRCLDLDPAEPGTGRRVLALVADGMGGHAAGEVASRLAADALTEAFRASEGDPHEALRAAFLAANQAVFQASASDDRLYGMGTTCTALVLQGGRAFSAHVGDSRLYRVQEERIEALSEDHTLVHEMVMGGMLSAEEARTHEDRNIITRALGLYPEVDVATWEAPLPLQPGDRFVLCSDGLYDLVEDDEIRVIVTAHTAEEAGKQLVALAKARGGYDNITVIVIGLGPPEPDDDDRAVPEAGSERP